MTVETIKKEMIDAKERINELSDLNSTSKVSVWRLWAYIVSFVAHTHRQLQLVHMQEVNNAIDTQHFSSELRIQKLLFDFRYGHQFNRSTLRYADVYTEDQIEQAKTIKRAAVEIVAENGRKLLRIKVAKLENGKLQPVPSNELFVLNEYIDINTPAGTNYTFYSSAPDQLRLNIDFYYDPLILDANGELLDGSAPAPVPTAINEFLAAETFDFQGELRLSELTDVLQNVYGISNRSVKINSAQYSTQIPANWQEINESRRAISGGFEISEQNLTINYIAK